MSIPFAEYCERNKGPIFEVLKTAFSECRQVLEIGSGTGQHAVYFASQLPHLVWHPSDQQSYLAGLRAQVNHHGLDNVRAPLLLDVTEPWPLTEQHQIDGIYSANTLHIMSPAMVEAFFAGVGRYLDLGGQLCIYGPFNYGGDYTSESNRAFDQKLRQADPLRGIKEFEWICELAAGQGLCLIADLPMPANNRLLHFCRECSAAG